MRRAALSAVVLAAVAVGGCGSAGPATRAIDISRGAYRGVGIGSSSRRMFRVFGRARPSNLGAEPVTPRRVDQDDWAGAWSSRIAPRARFQLYRYATAAFVVANRRVTYIVVMGGRVRSGVGIGSRLSDVKARGRARCGISDNGEHGSWPACIVHPRPHVYLWFGGDPVTTVEIGMYPFSL